MSKKFVSLAIGRRFHELCVIAVGNVCVCTFIYSILTDIIHVVGLVHITEAQNLFSATPCPLRSCTLVHLRLTFSAIRQILPSATLFYQVHSLYLLCSLLFGTCSLVVERASLKIKRDNYHSNVIKLILRLRTA